MGKKAIKFIVMLTISIVILVTTFVIGYQFRGSVKETELREITKEIFINSQLPNVKEIDVNDDGFLDLQIEAYNNDVRAGYYYLLNTGREDKPNYQALLWNKALAILGEKLIFKDKYLISIKRDGIGSGSTPLYEIDGYVYQNDKENPPFSIELAWLFQPKPLKDATNMNEINAYVDWLNKLTSAPKAENPTSKEITLLEAKQLLLSGNITSLFVPHEPGNTSMSDIFGNSYTIKHDHNDDVWKIIKECGEKCKYISTALE